MDFFPAQADDIFVSRNSSGIISEYSSAGTTINPTVLSGLTSVGRMGISGNTLFFDDVHHASIGAYNILTGTYNPSFIYTGISYNPFFYAVSGNTLYTADQTGDIHSYNLTTGAALSTITLPSGDVVNDMAIWRNNLYVIADSNSGIIGDYDISTGTYSHVLTVPGAEALAANSNDLFVATYNKIYGFNLSGVGPSSFSITGPNLILGLGASDTDLYIAETGIHAIGDYNLATGILNSLFITGDSSYSPFGVTVYATPEPQVIILLVGSLIALGGWQSRKTFGTHCGRRVAKD